MYYGVNLVYRLSSCTLESHTWKNVGLSDDKKAHLFNWNHYKVFFAMEKLCSKKSALKYFNNLGLKLFKTN